jgi:hypothetical protein
MVGFAASEHPVQGAVDDMHEAVAELSAKGWITPIHPLEQGVVVE